MYHSVFVSWIDTGRLCMFSLGTDDLFTWARKRAVMLCISKLIYCIFLSRCSPQKNNEKLYLVIQCLRTKRRSPILQHTKEIAINSADIAVFLERMSTPWLKISG
jgi:hypothetical protein